MWTVSQLFHLSVPEITLGWGHASRRVILPWLLIQQQNFFLNLPWFSAAVQFIGQKVPLSSLLCKGFDKAWLLWVSRSSPPYVQSPLGCVVCGRLGMLTMCHPGSSKQIFPYNFHIVIFFTLSHLPRKAFRYVCWFTIALLMVLTVINVHIVNVCEYHMTAGITTVENSSCKRELNFRGDLKKLN